MGTRERAAAYRGRLEQLAARAEKEGGGAALLQAPPTLHYLTGVRLTPHERFTALLVEGSSRPVLIVPALDAEHAREQRELEDLQILAWQDGEDPCTLVRTALDRIGAPSVAVERRVCTMATADRLISAGVSLGEADAGVWTAELRMRKDAGELDALRRAARVADRIFAEVPPRLLEGTTERELARWIEMRLGEESEGGAFGVSVLGGENAANPHGVPGYRPLGDGDLVLMDFGAVVDGYCSDLSRTLGMGTPSPRLHGLHAAVLAAQEAALGAVRPGATAGEVDEAARNVLRRRGLAERFVHRVGHGLGLEPHEPPSLAPGSNVVLEPGMVLTIEPGVYVPGEAGVRIEDMVLVTDTDCEVLTRAPRGLDG